MNQLSRRSLLAGAVASAVAAPLAPRFVCAAATAAPVPLKPCPVFAVGTDGGWDWQLIPAHSLKEAKEIWLGEAIGADCCEALNDGDAPCGPDTADPCDYCSHSWSLDGHEVKALAGKKHFVPSDFYKGGIGAYCSRCDYETSPYDNGYAVGDEAVCTECMTLADWRIVNPRHAAELELEARTRS